jgi:hypothetical protein
VRLVLRVSASGPVFRPYVVFLSSSRTPDMPS